MILAIESSCDESALALFDPARGLVRELISSQAAEHEKYGGVVPELASRMHLSALPLLLADFHAELASARTIAVTRGPGLLPCLSMGVTLARSLALARGLPIVGAHHHPIGLQEILNGRALAEKLGIGNHADVGSLQRPFHHLGGAHRNSGLVHHDGFVWQVGRDLFRSLLHVTEIG